MQAISILRLVSAQLQDIEPGLEARWPWEGDDERIGLLDFLNSGLRAAAAQRPDLFAVTESILLEPGMRQTLPDRRKHSSSRDATMLIELVRNMGAAGDEPGLPILPVVPDVLMAWARAWHGQCARVVENYAIDRAVSPKSYLVYPAVAPDCDVWVEATYSAEPRLVTCAGDELEVQGIVHEALGHHMLASILSGDNWSANAQKASWHMQMFASVLGVKTAVDFAWPKARSSVNSATSA